MSTELASPCGSDSSAGLGAWSRNAPTEPGHYWVWQDGGTWPCFGTVHCVLVRLERGRMVAWVPFMDCADAVVCSDSENTWMDALWLGPMAPPKAPNA
jgi:hypothetical protein